MGREAVCTCQWGSRSGEVTVVLESRELIVRGALRGRIPIAQIKSLEADGESLPFAYGGETVSLMLGLEVAAKWEATLRKTPATLAQKLGITPTMRVRVLGEVDDSALEAALSEADQSPGPAGLAIACTATRESLMEVLQQTASEREAGTPLWIVYPKGSGQLLGEAEVRAFLRESGMVDTKVAAVSARLTALRFQLRKG